MLFINMREIDGYQTLNCLGPADTFTERAGQNVIRERAVNPEANIVLCQGIDEVFANIVNSNSLGIVPIENSGGGPVAETIKGLYEHASDIQIMGEYNLSVPQSLFYAPGEEPRIFASKLNALKQCRQIVRNNSTIETISTAAAIALAASEPQIAAIGPQWAGSQWIEEGRLLRVDYINDDPNSKTRFIIVAPRTLEMPTKTGQDKTTLILTLDDQAGSLYPCLKAFFQNGINLTQIRSFSNKKQTEKPQAEVQMLITLDGHREDENVRNTLTELRNCTQSVINFGSYPEALEKNPDSQPSLSFEELVSAHKDEILKSNGNGENGHVVVAFMLKDEPGALMKAIEPFARANINLVSINSMATGILDKHLFYLAIKSGQPEEEFVLEELKKRCTNLVYLSQRKEGTTVYQASNELVA